MYFTQIESQQKTEVTPEDSDLDRKRRETEALLQSIGISPEPPLGTIMYFQAKKDNFHFNFALIQKIPKLWS